MLRFTTGRSGVRIRGHGRLAGGPGADSGKTFRLSPACYVHARYTWVRPGGASSKNV